MTEAAGVPSEVPGFALRGDCPLCGSGSLRDRYRVDGFTVTDCRDCGQVFVREVIPTEELARYYMSSEGDQVYLDPDNEANLNFYDERLKRSIERLRAKGRILDIGCERGRFLDVMEGWERYGIEILPSLGAIARAHHGERIHIGTLDDYPGPTGFFDVITLLDSLDHMPDPRMVLARCRSLLVAGGLLVVKVHNIGCLYARVTGSRFYAIIPPYHLYYFTRPTLQRLLRSEGLTPIATRFFPHRLSVQNIFFRLSRGKETGVAHRVDRFLRGSRLGRLTVRKNLRDIMTTFAARA